MLKRRQVINLENSKISKRRRPRFRSRCLKKNFPNASDENGSLRTTINPSYAETLVSDEDLHTREDHLDHQFSEYEQWTRTVRSMETDGETSHVDSDKRERLRTTAMWRKLLLPQVDVGSPSISEEIFKENVKTLLDGIDSVADKPSQWSRLDTNFYFNKILSFTDNWSRQLLIEKDRLDEEVWLAKEKLKVKYDLVTNRLSFLTGVVGDSVSSMNFSEFQKKAIQIKTEELIIIKNKWIGCEGGNLDLQEASFVNQQKENEQKLSESNKQADEYREELSKMQNKLKVTETELINVNQELSESRKKAHKELNKAQNKLKEIEEKLHNLVYANKQKAQFQHTEMQVKWSEIQAMLVKKYDSKNQNGLCLINDLNKEYCQILKVTKSLIQYRKQLMDDEDVLIIDETVQETASGSGVLKVTENEMHLVTLIASFLKVTPFPVSSEFIYSYVANIDNVVDLQYVESLLKKFPTFFKEVAIAPGSTQKNWSYLDLKPIITI